MLPVSDKQRLYRVPMMIWATIQVAFSFNLLNRANFGKPSSSSLFTATGGRVGSAGRITKTVGDARQMQLSLKLLF